MAETKNAWGPLQPIRDKLAIRRAVKRAKKLMGEKCLTCEQKKERDSLVKLLGEKGNSREHALLKEWAVSGELCCRPPPQVLAGAIAMGGLDELHLKKMRQTIGMGLLADFREDKWVYGRNVPVDEQYYLAVLIMAESGLLLQDIRHGHSTLLALLENQVSGMVALMEMQMPGMVDLLKREMDA